jgi:predicted NUDIX family NTP pyrophosphohydrolase
MQEKRKIFLMKRSSRGKRGIPMAKKSAGLSCSAAWSGVEVFLVHPEAILGRKDEGAWSIPGGEYARGRSFSKQPRGSSRKRPASRPGDFIPQSRKQPSGKVISAWAVEGDCDASTMKSNTFSMEWPPRSGKQQEFPEVDRAEWFTIPAAKEKILKGQAPFLDELIEILDRR